MGRLSAYVFFSIWLNCWFDLFRSFSQWSLLRYFDREMISGKQFLIYGIPVVIDIFVSITHMWTQLPVWRVSAIVCFSVCICHCMIVSGIFWLRDDSRGTISGFRHVSHQRYQCHIYKILFGLGCLPSCSICVWSSSAPRPLISTKDIRTCMHSLRDGWFRTLLSPHGSWEMMSILVETG